MTLTWFLAAFVGSIAFLALFLSMIAVDECFDLRRALTRHLGGSWDLPFNVTDYDGGTP